MKTFGTIVLGMLFSIFSINSYALWQCYAADKGGHFWESKGLTQENAQAVALSFCKSFSPHGTSCEPRKCMEHEEG